MRAILTLLLQSLSRRILLQTCPKGTFDLEEWKRFYSNNDDEGDIDLAPPEPKQKDPFADMPKGTFDLEEWKRFYSNNDEEESVKWFWEHFDHENYSIWRGDYKY